MFLWFQIAFERLIWWSAQKDMAVTRKDAFLLITAISQPQINIFERLVAFWNRIKLYYKYVEFEKYTRMQIKIIKT